MTLEVFIGRGGHAGQSRWVLVRFQRAVAVEGRCQQNGRVVRLPGSVVVWYSQTRRPRGSAGGDQGRAHVAARQSRAPHSSEIPQHRRARMRVITAGWHCTARGAPLRCSRGTLLGTTGRTVTTSVAIFTGIRSCVATRCSRKAGTDALVSAATVANASYARTVNSLTVLWICSTSVVPAGS